MLEIQVCNMKFHKLNLFFHFIVKFLECGH
jgi:hypothetical protein